MTAFVTGLFDPTKPLPGTEGVPLGADSLGAFVQKAAGRALKRDSVTWFAYAVALLKLVALDPPEDVQGHRPRIARLSHGAKEAIGGAERDRSAAPTGDVVDGASASALVKLFERHSDLSVAERLLAIARGVDAGAWSLFVSAYRTAWNSKPIVEMRPDVAFPVTWPKPNVRKTEYLSPAFTKSFPLLTSGPGSLELRPWESEHLRFWDRPSSGQEISISLDFQHADSSIKRFDRRDASDLLVTLHPWCREDDWRFYDCAGKEVDEHSDLTPQPMWYRPVRSPVKWLRRWLNEAPWGSKPPLVVSLPEYALQGVPGEAKAIGDFLAALPPDRRPAIVVGGSGFEILEKERVNRLWAWILNKDGRYVPHDHVKQFPVPGECAKRAKSPSFTLLQLGSSHRLAVGVCRDLLHPDVIPLLRRAGVNLIVAPTDSPDLETMVRELGALAGVNQAVAVLPNVKAVHHTGDLRFALHELAPHKGPWSEPPVRTEADPDRGGKLDIRVTDWAAFVTPYRPSESLRLAEWDTAQPTEFSWEEARVTAWGGDKGRIAWCRIDGLGGVTSIRPDKPGTGGG